MPELPEVETYKTYLDSTALHHKITAVVCDDKRLVKSAFSDFEEKLTGARFTKTTRIGKYLFVETDRSHTVVMHFGMTGNLTYYKDPEDQPKYAQVIYGFANGFHLAFTNKRKFGWNDITESIEEYQQKLGLSHDALDITFGHFIKSVKNRKTAIKKVLMDQKVAAGVGNLMADEILYQAEIHPEQPVNGLSEKELKKVFGQMQRVLQMAVKKQAVYKDFPKNYLIHSRKKGGKCYYTGNPLKTIKVGGRTTYFCEKRQKLKN